MLHLLQDVLKKFLSLKDPLTVFPDPPHPVVALPPSASSWSPTEKCRVQRGPNWRWFNQDTGAGGTVTSVQEQWVQVKWDNGVANWYLHGASPDLMESACADIKAPAKLRQTPVEWVESLLHDIFTRQFDADFAQIAADFESGPAADGDRILAWLDVMVQPLEALNLTVANVNKLTCARLLVHACFSRGLMTKPSFFTSGSPACCRMLVSIGDAMSNEQFRAFFSAKVQELSAHSSAFESILAGVWASAFVAIDQDAKADADVLCQLFGVFLKSNSIPSLVHHGNACGDDCEEIHAVQGLCLHCNLPWMSHNGHECRVGWNKGSSGEWVTSDDVDPSISASASLIGEYRVFLHTRALAVTHLHAQTLSSCFRLTRHPPPPPPPSPCRQNRVAPKLLASACDDARPR